MINRPKCCIEGCENVGFIIMWGKVFCGECVSKWHKAKSQEEEIKMRMLLE